MRESRPRGSVRGALSNERPYRENAGGLERREGVARLEFQPASGAAGDQQMAEFD